MKNLFLFFSFCVFAITTSFSSSPPCQYDCDELTIQPHTIYDDCSGAILCVYPPNSAVPISEVCGDYEINWSTGANGQCIYISASNSPVTLTAVVTLWDGGFGSSDILCQKTLSYDFNIDDLCCEDFKIKPHPDFPDVCEDGVLCVYDDAGQLISSLDGYDVIWSNGGTGQCSSVTPADFNTEVCAYITRYAGNIPHSEIICQDTICYYVMCDPCILDDFEIIPTHYFPTACDQSHFYVQDGSGNVVTGINYPNITLVWDDGSTNPFYGPVDGGACVKVTQWSGVPFESKVICEVKLCFTCCKDWEIDFYPDFGDDPCKGAVLCIYDEDGGPIWDCPEYDQVTWSTGATGACIWVTEADQGEICAIIESTALGCIDTTCFTFVCDTCILDKFDLYPHHYWPTVCENSYFSVVDGNGTVVTPVNYPNITILWEDGSTGPVFGPVEGGTCVTITQWAGEPFESEIICKREICYDCCKLDDLVLKPYQYEEKPCDKSTFVVVDADGNIINSDNCPDVTFLWDDGSTGSTSNFVEGGTCVTITQWAGEPYKSEIICKREICYVCCKIEDFVLKPVEYFPTPCDKSYFVIVDADGNIVNSANCPDVTFLWDDGSTGSTSNQVEGGTCVVVTQWAGVPFESEIICKEELCYVCCKLDDFVLKPFEFDEKPCDKSNFVVVDGNGNIINSDNCPDVTFLWDDGSTGSTSNQVEGGTCVVVTQWAGEPYKSEIICKEELCYVCCKLDDLVLKPYQYEEKPCDKSTFVVVDADGNIINSDNCPDVTFLWDDGSTGSTSNFVEGGTCVVVTQWAGEPFKSKVICKREICYVCCKIEDFVLKPVEYFPTPCDKSYFVVVDADGNIVNSVNCPDVTFLWDDGSTGSTSNQVEGGTCVVVTQWAGVPYQSEIICKEEICYVCCKEFVIKFDPNYGEDPCEGALLCLYAPDGTPIGDCPEYDQVVWSTGAIGGCTWVTAANAPKVTAIVESTKLGCKDTLCFEFICEIPCKIEDFVLKPIDFDKDPCDKATFVIVDTDGTIINGINCPNLTYLWDDGSTGSTSNSVEGGTCVKITQWAGVPYQSEIVCQIKICYDCCKEFVIKFHPEYGDDPCEGALLCLYALDGTPIGDCPEYDQVSWSTGAFGGCTWVTSADAPKVTAIVESTKFKCSDTLCFEFVCEVPCKLDDLKLKPVEYDPTPCDKSYFVIVDADGTIINGINCPDLTFLWDDGSTGSSIGPVEGGACVKITQWSGVPFESKIVCEVKICYTCCKIEKFTLVPFHYQSNPCDESYFYVAGEDGFPVNTTDCPDVTFLWDDGSTDVYTGPVKGGTCVTVTQWTGVPFESKVLCKIELCYDCCKEFVIKFDPKYGEDPCDGALLCLYAPDGTPIAECPEYDQVSWSTGAFGGCTWVTSADAPKVTAIINSTELGCTDTLCFEFVCDTECKLVDLKLQPYDYDQNPCEKSSFRVIDGFGNVINGINCPDVTFLWDDGSTGSFYGPVSGGACVKLTQWAGIPYFSNVICEVELCWNCDGDGNVVVIDDVKESYSELSHQVIISPNPVSDILTVSNLDNEIVQTMSIFDTNGRLVNKYKVVDSRQQVDVSEFDSGLYLLQSRDNNGHIIINKKFIVIK